MNEGAIHSGLIERLMCTTDGPAKAELQDAEGSLVHSF